MNGKLVEQLTVRGITVYRFYNNSRDAVDSYLNTMAFPLLKEHVKNNLTNVPLCIVMDVSRTGMLPVSYMLTRIRQNFSLYETLPEYYIAFIIKNLDDELMVRMIEGMTVGSLAHTRRTYSAEAFDEAIDWLVTIQSKYRTE